jgi:hypothetical protein
MFCIAQYATTLESFLKALIFQGGTHVSEDKLMERKHRKKAFGVTIWRHDKTDHFNTLLTIPAGTHQLELLKLQFSCSVILIPTQSYRDMILKGAVRVTQTFQDNMTKGYAEKNFRCHHCNG